ESRPGTDTRASRRRETGTRFSGSCSRFSEFELNICSSWSPRSSKKIEDGLASRALLAIVANLKPGICRVGGSSKVYQWLCAAMIAGPIALAPLDAVLAGCKPDHFRPLFFIKSMGACAFDNETLSFVGSPVDQAMCLMRGMDATRNLQPRLPGLPPALAERIGQTTGLPSRAALSDYLSTVGLEGEFGDFLWLPV